MDTKTLARQFGCSIDDQINVSEASLTEDQRGWLDTLTEAFEKLGDEATAYYATDQGLIGVGKSYAVMAHESGRIGKLDLTEMGREDANELIKAIERRDIDTIVRAIAAAIKDKSAMQKLIVALRAKGLSTATESGDEQEAYRAFFKAKLKKYGVDDPSELSKEQRKKFFDEIEREWTKDDEDESVAEAAKTVTFDSESDLEDARKKIGTLRRQADLSDEGNFKVEQQGPTKLVISGSEDDVNAAVSLAKGKSEDVTETYIAAVRQYGGAPDTLSETERRGFYAMLRESRVSETFDVDADPSDTYVVRWRSVFDNPETKYRSDVYAKALKRAGATKTWNAPYPHSNQPDQVHFTGITPSKAKAALERLPEFKTWGAIIDRVDESRVSEALDYEWLGYGLRIYDTRSGKDVLLQGEEGAELYDELEKARTDRQVQMLLDPYTEVMETTVTEGDVADAWLGIDGCVFSEATDDVNALIAQVADGFRAEVHLDESKTDAAEKLIEQAHSDHRQIATYFTPLREALTEAASEGRYDPATATGGFRAALSAVVEDANPGTVNEAAEMLRRRFEESLADTEQNDEELDGILEYQRLRRPQRRQRMRARKRQTSDKRQRNRERRKKYRTQKHKIKRQRKRWERKTRSRRKRYESVAHDEIRIRQTVAGDAEATELAETFADLAEALGTEASVEAVSEDVTITLPTVAADVIFAYLDSESDDTDLDDALNEWSESLPEQGELTDGDDSDVDPAFESFCRRHGFPVPCAEAVALAMESGDDGVYFAASRHAPLLVVGEEKWAQKVDVEKGKMHKLLGVPQDENIDDYYASGESLAKALLGKTSRKQAAGMINYAANVGAGKLYTDAQRYLSKTSEGLDERNKLTNDDELEDALLARMQQSDSITSKEMAIRIAKTNGLIKQDGRHLALTPKGVKAAKKAKSHLESLEERMSERDLIQQFRDDILPEIVKRYETGGQKDIPARREAWNDWLDSLEKDGQITAKQAEMGLPDQFESAESLVAKMLDEIEGDDAEDVECPACGGQQIERMGSLGKRTHYRCRNCGMQFSSTTERAKRKGRNESIDEAVKFPGEGKLKQIPFATGAAPAELADILSNVEHKRGQVDQAMLRALEVIAGNLYARGTNVYNVDVLRGPGTDPEFDTVSYLFLNLGKNDAPTLAYNVGDRKFEVATYNQLTSREDVDMTMHGHVSEADLKTLVESAVGQAPRGLNEAVARREFTKVADILKGADIDDKTREKLARKFAEWFKTENPRFDAARFGQACGVDLSESTLNEGPGAGVTFQFSGDRRMKPQFDETGVTVDKKTLQVRGDIKVRDLRISSYYNSASVKDAGVITDIDITSRAMKELRQDLADLREGVVSIDGITVDDVYGIADVTWSTGYTRAAAPSSVEVEGTLVLGVESTVTYKHDPGRTGKSYDTIPVAFEGGFVPSREFKTAYAGLDESVVNEYYGERAYPNLKAVASIYGTDEAYGGNGGEAGFQKPEGGYDWYSWDNDKGGYVFIGSSEGIGENVTAFNVHESAEVVFPASRLDEFCQRIDEVGFPQGAVQIEENGDGVKATVNRHVAERLLPEFTGNGVEYRDAQ